jgi:hypothetical protein
MRKSDDEPPEVSLLQYIPQTSENRYFYENGLSKIIPKLKVRVHSDIETCYYLWDLFSPKESLFDLWDFRDAWYKGYGYTPFFYTLYEGKKCLGTLPLWFNSVKKEYQWFGSDWMEDNTFFTVDEKLIPLLIAIAPPSTYINALDINKESLGKYKASIKEDCPKNIKDLTKFKNINDYLMTLTKKERHHLRSDSQKIENYEPSVIINDTNNLGNLIDLIKLNVTRFSGEDSSDFIDEKRVRTFEAIVKNSGIYQTKFVRVEIQGYLAAIDLIITYKEKYYTPKGGNDIARFSGVGNYMVYIEFEDAINNGFTFFDNLQVDYGWKHWYFDQKSLYEIRCGR